MEELHTHSKMLKTNQEITFSDPIKKYAPNLADLADYSSWEYAFCFTELICIVLFQVQWCVQARRVPCQTKGTEATGKAAGSPPPPQSAFLDSGLPCV
jgi:hypothetical protein